MRARDLDGLQRTLAHLAALEDESGETRVATELREALAVLALARERSVSGTLTGTG